MVTSGARAAFVSRDGASFLWRGLDGSVRAPFATLSRGPATVASGDDLVTTSAVVFWTSSGALYQADLYAASCCAVPLEQAITTQLAARDSSIFFGAGGDIVRWDYASRARTILATGQHPSGGLAIARGRVYWSDGTGSDATLRSVPFEGGAVAIEQPCRADRIAVDEQEALWFVRLEQSGELTVAASDCGRGKAAHGPAGAQVGFAAYGGVAYWAGARCLQATRFWPAGEREPETICLDEPGHAVGDVRVFVDWLYYVRDGEIAMRRLD